MIPIKIGTFNFECLLNQTEKPVLLIFGAEWDNMSRRLCSLTRTIPKRFEDKIFLGKVDLDMASDIFTECNVTTLPTIILFDDGVEFERQTGFTGHEQIISLLSRFFGVDV